MRRMARSVPKKAAETNCRKEPVRFGSVRKIRFPGSTRFGLRFSDTLWLGPVRFSSASGFGRFQNQTFRFGSVRFCRFGSVSYSFLNIDRLSYASSYIT